VLMLSSTIARADSSNCLSLTGLYELHMGTMQLEQSGCGKNVTIKRTIRTKRGGVFVTEYLLDGVKRYSQDRSASQMHIWQDNVWFQYHEVQAGGGPVMKMGGAHYLNANRDLVKEDFDPTEPIRIYKRLR